LGSEICFDCGAKLSRTEWEPWETREKTTIRKNTGEKSFARSQARQSRHESGHTAHSVSREAGGAAEGVAHRSPHHQATMQRFVRQESSQKPQQKSGKAKMDPAVLRPLIVVAFAGFLSLMGYLCALFE
jgi:cobalamin biosynthesis Mg chelatase CobN